MIVSEFQEVSTRRSHEQLRQFAPEAAVQEEKSRRDQAENRSNADSIMKGYNTSIAVTLTVGTAGVILVMLLSLAGPVDGRERPSGYEVYRNRQQRLQMEREAQMKRLEEKNSEFVKGKSKLTFL